MQQGQDDVIGRRGSMPKGVARRQEILDRAIEVRNMEMPLMEMS